MLFNSFDFAVFFAAVLLVYWLLPTRPRIWFVLGSSYFFYGYWDYRFLSLIAASTLVDYTIALAIHRSDDPRRRLLLLRLSLTASLGLLGFFKYFNFFVESLVAMLTELGVFANLTTLEIILPVGISFYTFQTMSYTIDVYRRDAEPTRDLVAFAAFIAFFPQLVAGPIERFSNLYPQLTRRPVAHIHYLRQGVFLLLQGFLKKIVIADSVAPTVDRVFANPGAHNAGQLLEAAILFTIQIYADFSGYSDIACGVAFLLGIQLVANFRAPLFSRSITEFWRRWHISLSGWLRDYLYVPLGGNRKGRLRTYVNLLLTMLLGGLWHGASWKWVVWGGVHGGLLGMERAFGWGTDDSRPALSPRALAWAALRVIVCFSAVTLLFVLFRASSLTSAWLILSHIAQGQQLLEFATPRLGLALAAILAIDVAVLWTDRQAWILDSPVAFRIALYSAMLFAILVASGHKQQSFIYFAF